MVAQIGKIRSYVPDSATVIVTHSGSELKSIVMVYSAIGLRILQQLVVQSISNLISTKKMGAFGKL